MHAFYRWSVFFTRIFSLKGDHLVEVPRFSRHYTKCLRPLQSPKTFETLQTVWHPFTSFFFFFFFSFHLWYLFTVVSHQSHKLTSSAQCNLVQTDQALGSKNTDFPVLPSLTETVVFIWQDYSLHQSGSCQELPSQTLPACSRGVCLFRWETEGTMS